MTCKVLPPSHFTCLTFLFNPSQNFVHFPKINIITLLGFLFYPFNYLIFIHPNILKRRAHLEKGEYISLHLFSDLILHFHFSLFFFFLQLLHSHFTTDRRNQEVGFFIFLPAFLHFVSPLRRKQAPTPLPCSSCWQK